MTIPQGTTIACIGLGNMGAAIIHGLARQFNREHIFGFDIDPEKASALSHHLTPCATMEEAAQKAKVVIIAIKPDTVSAALNRLAPLPGTRLIMSIAAGVTLSTMEDALGTDAAIIRVMPNTPALVGEGMTVLSPNSRVDQINIGLAECIFSLLGKVLIMPEKYLNAVTAISGCGPAYVCTFIQALTDAGVRMGLPRDKALILATQTVKGTATMIDQTAEGPIELRNKVTSPGGATIAAIHIMERAAFSGIIMDAALEAEAVSEKLGKKK